MANRLRPDYNERVKAHSRQFIDDANEATEVKRKAKAVILYDDLGSLLTAQQLLTRLEPDGDRRADWMVSSWRFDMLTLKRRLEAYRAMEESVDAELMVITIREAEAWARLPVDWLGLWRDHRHSPAARLLLMSIGQTSEWQFEPHIGVLRRMAEARALPFSVFRGVVPDEEALRNSRTRISVTEVAGLSGRLAVKKS